MEPETMDTKVSGNLKKYLLWLFNPDGFMPIWYSKVA
jgi:hypothetical protein